MVLRVDAVGAGGFLAEMQKPADLESKFRQRTVIVGRQIVLLHDCQALLTIQAEKPLRKSLKPSRCCGGNWDFTSAPSRVFSKQASQTWRARSSISKGKSLPPLRGGPVILAERGGAAPKGHQKHG